MPLPRLTMFAPQRARQRIIVAAMMQASLQAPTEVPGIAPVPRLAEGLKKGSVNTTLIHFVAYTIPSC